MVCPAVTLWLGVCELSEKSWTTFSGSGNVWLGSPDTSATERMTVYALDGLGAAPLGTFSVSVNVASTPAVIGIGFAGTTVQVAAETALASHVALTVPL